MKKEKIRFGPSGLGKIKDSIKTLEFYNSLGLKACEIDFTYNIYIKNKQDAIKIRKKAKELDIKLSIHAPYWINLNSQEKEKIKRSKERIIECCKIGTWLGASFVVFHPGYYSKDRKETLENIKKEIIEIKKEVIKKKYTLKLAPEIMGKKNVFGSIEEIKELVEETGCFFCLDFSHILARYGEYKFKETFENFKKSKEIHIHFSGIVYGEKGEKYHKKTEKKEFEKLISFLPKNKEITIISESPSPVEDSILGKNIFLKNKPFVSNS